MNKVVIFTDSTCDLSKELLSKYDINVIPLHVIFNDKEYLDGVDSDGEMIIDRAESENILPKTQAISPAEAIDAFKPYIDIGCDIFYCGLGAALSSTYNNVLLAKEELGEDRIYALDSMNLSTGISILLLKACKYRDKGCSAKEIYDIVSKKVDRVKSQFVMRGFEYLAKGGRCPSLVSRIGKTLRVRPLIVVRNGGMKVGNLTIGLMDKAVRKMTDTFLKHIDDIDHENLFVTFSPESEKYCEQIQERFREVGIFDQFKNIMFTKAGSVICSHCGPATIGILYLIKKETDDDYIE